MNPIAYCILTYNHPNEIRYVLSQIWRDFQTHGIDIYILDSSSNRETYQVTKQFIDDGTSNVYYMSCDENLTGDEKYIYLLSQSSLSHKYQYLWPSKDRTVFSGSNLDQLIQAVQSLPDVILLTSNINRSEYIISEKKELYTNMVELFRDYGALSSSWESVVYRCNTMLNDTDWSFYINRYHLGRNNNFNQPVFLFARLADLKNPTVKCIEVNPNERTYLSSTESMWIKDTFSVFGKIWIDAIHSLPSIYDPYKAHVIKSETMLPELFGSVDNLFYYYDRGILNENTYNQISIYWNRLSDIPLEYLDFILNDQFELLLPQILNWYNQTLLSHDYPKAIWLYQTNSWLNMYLGEDVYESISQLYDCYISDLNHHLENHLFDRITEIKGVLIPLV